MLRNLIKRDDGVGMTELSIAILVLGIILVGLFPLVINSLGLAKSNSEVGQGNRIVSTQLDIARNELADDSCAEALAPGVTLTLSDRDDELFNARRIVNCNESNTLATVTINVTRNSDGEVVSTATTQIVTSP